MIVADASVWVSRFLPQGINHEICKAWLADRLAGGGRTKTKKHAMMQEFVDDGRWAQRLKVTAMSAKSPYSD